MRSKTFAQLMLFVPYLVLGVLWVIDANNTLFIAIFAFIPYTILTASLLLWSKNKTADKMKDTYTYYAPLWLTGIVTVLYLLLISMMLASSMASSYVHLLIMAGIVSVPVSLVIGYFCCGILLILHEILQRIGLVVE
jgi:hypothetical protein